MCCVLLPSETTHIYKYIFTKYVVSYLICLLFAHSISLHNILYMRLCMLCSVCTVCSAVSSLLPIYLTRLRLIFQHFTSLFRQMHCINLDCVRFSILAFLILSSAFGPIDKTHTHTHKRAQNQKRDNLIVPILKVTMRQRSNPFK